MRSRIAAASSSERVRSGDWKTRREGHRFPPLADLLAAVDVEDPDLAQLRAGRLRAASSSAPASTSSATDDREVLPHRRIRDHVLVQDDVRDTCEERRQVELERAPPAQQPRMELADPARLDPGRLARVQERLVRPLDVAVT